MNYIDSEIILLRVSNTLELDRAFFKGAKQSYNEILGMFNGCDEDTYYEDISYSLETTSNKLANLVTNAPNDLLNSQYLGALYVVDEFLKFANHNLDDAFDYDQALGVLNLEYDRREAYLSGAESAAEDIPGIISFFEDTDTLDTHLDGLISDEEMLIDDDTDTLIRSKSDGYTDMLTVATSTLE